MRNSIATKEIIVAIKVEKNHEKYVASKKKNLATKLKSWRQKFLSRQNKTMSQQKDEEEITEDYRDSVFFVATFLTFVAT